MIAVNSKRTELLVKALALLTGILIGVCYASFGRLVGKAQFTNPKVMTSNFMSISISQNQEINETAQFLVADDTEIADTLKATIKVLCWIHVTDVNLFTLEAIQRTWGTRCTKFIAIANQTVNKEDVFSIPNDENKTSNIKNAYRFLHKTYGKDYDWFLRTDGNAYVVLENLRYALFAYDPTMSVGVGLLKYDKNNSEIYFSERAGYTLSKQALEELVVQFAKGPKCKGSKLGISDEKLIGLCLLEMNVRYGNSTDQHGKQIFFEKHLDDFLLPEVEVKFPYPWYQDYKVNHYLDHASNYSITFYNITWEKMFVMEFLIYQLRPYGIETITPNLPEKVLFEKQNPLINF